MAPSLSETEEDTRIGEWFVPKFGGRRFRLLVGMSFYPYTLMNAAYVVIGSLLTPAPVHWDRVAALTLVYLLAVGVSAHALDATAPNRPWGNLLSRRQLEAIAISALVPALGIGLYYAVSFAPYLVPLGALELFFLLAYNIELLGGRFHTDAWFALSWGGLPVVAGYLLQTNYLSPIALAGGLFGFLTAFAEINASRPYKALMKQRSVHGDEAKKFENILKGLVSSNLALALVLVILRSAG